MLFRSTRQKERSGWLAVLLEMLKEPMLLLLIATTIIYFILGETGEAYFMLSAIIIVSGISFYQDRRSRKALEGLQALNQPMASVIRKGTMQQVALEEIVVKDLVIVEEGNSIPADGTIVYSTDFSVNESILTGESFTVYKSATNDDNKIYFEESFEKKKNYFTVKNNDNSSLLDFNNHNNQYIKQSMTWFIEEVKPYI
mgnify:CR=1 FL=1